MDHLILDEEVLKISSNFASLLTVARMKIKEIGKSVEKQEEMHLKVTNESHLQNNETFEANTEEANSIEQTKQWLNELKQHIIELEFFGRAMSLRPFYYKNNYLPIVRTQARVDNYEHHVIPIYEIVFPKSQSRSAVPKVTRARERKCIKRNWTNDANQPCRNLEKNGSNASDAEI